MQQEQENRKAEEEEGREAPLIEAQEASREIYLFLSSLPDQISTRQKVYTCIIEAWKFIFSIILYFPI